MLQEQGAPLATGIQGQFNLYFNGPEKAYQDISFNLQSVSIISEDGRSIELLDRPLKINSKALESRQLLLAERYLDEGRYRKIKIVIKEPTIKKREIAHLSFEIEIVELDINVMINRNQNASLFISWNADASLVDGFIFRPLFIVKRQVPELSTLLIYVTNEGSDNVSVINRKTGEVVGMVMTGKRPKGIATGLRRDSLRVYVANSGSNSISVINPTTNIAETEIPLRLGWQPEDVVVARASNDREMLFVANYGSNNVSIVDGITYQEVEKVNVGSGPVAITADPMIESLFDMRFLSIENQNLLRGYRERYYNVYVANKNSRSVSVIVMDRFTHRPVDVINLIVEWSPVEISVDYSRAKVYVSNYESDKLSVIDIIQLIKGNRAGAVSNIAGIGRTAVGVINDLSFDSLYILREFPGEILILKPSFEDSAVKTFMPSIIGKINLKGSPRAFVMDPEGRKIYVVNRADSSLTVIDKYSNKEEKSIPLSKKPSAIAMFPF